MDDNIARIHQAAILGDRVLVMSCRSGTWCPHLERVAARGRWPDALERSPGSFETASTGERFDLVVVCLHSGGFATASQLVRPGGVLATVGEDAAASLRTAADLVLREVDVIPA